MIACSESKELLKGFRLSPFYFFKDSKHRGVKTYDRPDDECSKGKHTFPYAGTLTYVPLDSKQALMCSGGAVSEEHFKHHFRGVITHEH